jgi:DNA modification methylase
MEYTDFLKNKSVKFYNKGFEPTLPIASHLYPFQVELVQWALINGRSAIFADCGLGKTPIQLEWARQVCAYTSKPVIIFAPLAVSQQTQKEGDKFGVNVNICRFQKDIKDGINITNYEMLEHFTPDVFGGIVLDESSILKNYGGSTRTLLTEFTQGIDFRLACTATPAPNDLIEIVNHSEFLGVLSGKECIALFFKQDGNTTHNWRLKGHAKRDFWIWLSSWARAVRKPSDLGYEDGAFILPALNIEQYTTDGHIADGFLIPMEAYTLEERRDARRNSLTERVAKCAELVNDSTDAWIIWCNLNIESEALKRSIPDSVEVKGADSNEDKIERMNGFREGRYRVLITKPSIAGFGMNWQHCHNMAFVGLSDSYEQLYQAIRRCWRFGQKSQVNVHIIVAETEGQVVANIQRKEHESAVMMEQMVSHMQFKTQTGKTKDIMIKFNKKSGVDWTMYNGDCVEEMKNIESNSIGLSVFSPPFPGMYAYTNSSHDIGNSTHIDEMIEHFRYVVKSDNLHRILIPGRYACVHLMQLTAMMTRDGYIGIKDYRGRTIQMFEEEGWIYAGEVTIDKNPQIQATRNKERGLLFKTLATDSSKMRMALADYLLYFRKPGENPNPIRAGVSSRYDNAAGWITEQEWIEWAAPVWYRQTKGYPGGIRETDVLNVSCARESDDERHLCPLQLGVIERAVKLWSAPGETVFSPFAGIGSEGYVSLLHNRKFIGIELKESYFDVSCKNLNRAINERDNNDFDLFEGESMDI